MKKINACGVSCPQPVLMTKKALEDSSDGVEVTVDNSTSKANVKKYLLSRNYDVTVDEDEDGNFIIRAEK